MSNEMTIQEAATIVNGLSDDFESEEANEARAGSAWAAYATYVGKQYGSPDAEPVEQGMSDLLGDLMHLCDALEIDFSELTAKAARMYQEEVADPLG